MRLYDFIKLIKNNTNIYILDNNNNCLYSGNIGKLKKNIEKLGFTANDLIDVIRFSVEDRMVLYLG